MDSSGSGCLQKNRSTLNAQVNIALHICDTESIQNMLKLYLPPTVFFDTSFHWICQTEECIHKSATSYHWTFHKVTQIPLFNPMTMMLSLFCRMIAHFLIKVSVNYCNCIRYQVTLLLLFILLGDKIYVHYFQYE